MKNHEEISRKLYKNIAAALDKLGLRDQMSFVSAKGDWDKLTPTVREAVTRAVGETLEGGT